MRLRGKRKPQIALLDAPCIAMGLFYRFDGAKENQNRDTHAADFDEAVNIVVKCAGRWAYAAKPAPRDPQADHLMEGCKERDGDEGKMARHHGPAGM